MATERTTSRIQADRSISVRSTAFQPGEPIPTKYTADGENISPPIDVANLPRDTQALAILMEDVEAPGGVFTHWLAYNLPPEHLRIPEGVDVDSLAGDHVTGKNGRNSFGGVGYRGPEPPAGEAHRYHIVVYALREPLRLDGAVPRDRVERELQGRVLAMGEYTGTYSRRDE